MNASTKTPWQTAGVTGTMILANADGKLWPIGQMHTSALAAEAVACHNDRLERQDELERQIIADTEAQRALRALPMESEPLGEQEISEVERSHRKAVSNAEAREQERSEREKGTELDAKAKARAVWKP